jgi:hypothetical protein
MLDLSIVLRVRCPGCKAPLHKRDLVYYSTSSCMNEHHTFIFILIFILILTLQATSVEGGFRRMFTHSGSTTRALVISLWPHWPVLPERCFLKDVHECILYVKIGWL